jgi:large subunit ribosomal protein L6
MSRVGKMPVAIPAGVDVSIKEDQISVKGTGGTLSLHAMHWSRSSAMTAS